MFYWEKYFEVSNKVREQHGKFIVTLYSKIKEELKKHQKILEKKVWWVIAQKTGLQLL